MAVEEQLLREVLLEHIMIRRARLQIEALRRNDQHLCLQVAHKDLKQEVSLLNRRNQTVLLLPAMALKQPVLSIWARLRLWETTTSKCKRKWGNVKEMKEQESLHSQCPSTSQVQPKSFSNRRRHKIYHNHNRRFNNKVFSNNHPQKNPFSIWGKARIRSSKCHRWLHSKIHKQQVPFNNNNNRYLKLPLSAKHLSLHIP
jgi:hypothetical protein